MPRRIPEKDSGNKLPVMNNGRPVSDHGSREHLPVRTGNGRFTEKTGCF